MIIGAADEILTRSIPLMNTPLANNRETNGFRNLELTTSPGTSLCYPRFGEATEICASVPSMRQEDAAAMFLEERDGTGVALWGESCHRNGHQRGVRVKNLFVPALW
jgi:hypothetical protein